MTAATTGVFVALGSNLGDRLAHLSFAAQALAAHGDIKVVGASRVYETLPAGGPDGQGLFLNAVLKLEVGFSAHDLLLVLQGLELARGRTRTVPWGPRTLDLDVLLFGEGVIQSADLIVPHPFLAERAFVLVPLQDVWPEGLALPKIGLSIGVLLQGLGQTGVRSYRLAGPDWWRC